MKKMGLFLGVATLLTIGSVYAAWAYSGDDVAANEEGEISIAIADKTSNNAAGEITHVGSISFSVDQADNYYHGKLVAVTDNLKFTFNKTLGAEDKWDTVYFTWTITFVAGTYDSEPILEQKSGASLTGQTTTVTNEGTAWSFAASTITDAIQFNDALVIDTASKHDALSTALTSCKIGLSIDVIAGA